MSKKWEKLQQTSCVKGLLGSSDKINIFKVE